MEFFSNLDGLHEQIKASGRFKGQAPPSFRCEMDKTAEKFGRLNLHYYSFRRRILPFVGGTVEAVADMLFNLSVQLRVSPNRDMTSPHHMFFVTTNTNNNNQLCKLFADRGSNSTDPAKAKMSVRTFCASFPFHVIFDRNMQVMQLGTALLKMVNAERVAAEGGVQLRTLFDVVRPSVKISFSAFLSRLNSSFILRTKPMVSADTRVSNGRLGQVSKPDQMSVEGYLKRGRKLS